MSDDNERLLIINQVAAEQLQAAGINATVIVEDPLVEYAANLMLDAARRTEFMDIFDAAEDELGHKISDEDARKVWDLMCEASITVVVGGEEYESGPNEDDDEELV